MSEKNVDLSPHGQNGCRFADDIFRYIFMNEKFCILIKISLNFVPNGSIDNELGTEKVTSHYLNQCWPGSLAHICGTRGDELKGWNKKLIGITFKWLTNYLWIYLTVKIPYCLQIGSVCRCHSEHGLCQWEKALHSNSSSHWLSL